MTRQEKDGTRNLPMTGVLLAGAALNRSMMDGMAIGPFQTFHHHLPVEVGTIRPGPGDSVVAIEGARKRGQVFASTGRTEGAVVEVPDASSLMTNPREGQRRARAVVGRLIQPNAGMLFAECTLPKGAVRGAATVHSAMIQQGIPKAGTALLLGRKWG